MSKLSFEALAKKAEAVVSEELLTTISGGIQDICHDGGGGPDTTPDWDENENI
jgi:hypothetical protein